MNAANEEVYCAANRTTNKCVECQVRLSNAETEATAWTITDTDRIVNQLQSDIYGITATEQMLFGTEFSIHLIEFDAWWQVIAIVELRKTIKQCGIHFQYPKIHPASHASETNLVNLYLQKFQHDYLNGNISAMW